MPISTEKTTATVALMGNPNTGKSTLFTALVGVHQHVGNYPGVTVEKKTGRMEHQGRRFEVFDLPGLYSLSPRSRDESVAVEVLLGLGDRSPRVDAVVCVVDASNLQRNLYLVSQVRELGLPTVVALNMVDVAGRRGVAVDAGLLQQRLGIPVVPVQANRRIGVPQLKAALSSVLRRPPDPIESPFPGLFEKEVTALASLLTRGGAAAGSEGPWPRSLVRRLLLDCGGVLAGVLVCNKADRHALEVARERLAASGCAVPAIETAVRYAWIDGLLHGVVTGSRPLQPTATDRIDRLLTHRLWGTLVFAGLMVVVFQSVFSWARPLMGWIDTAFGALGAWVEAHLAEGPLSSLLVDGVVAGVGGVAVFLPQILILFLFIAVLEDCGYMARAAFLMDKVMVRVGLSGRSFIPMLSCFACAVPGIMATRVIENPRDRLTTILVAPLMTCSARLPVYALLIAAFIPQRQYLGGLVNLQGLTLVALYVLGIVTAVAVASILKRTLLCGGPPGFWMELPSYKWPSLRTMAYRVVQRCWLFVRVAGTLIVAVSILVWAALYYPRNTDFTAREPQVQQLQQQLAGLEANDPRRRQVVAALDREVLSQRQRHSLLGQLGRLVEPAVRPLGWDWRIGCAVIGSLPAREVVVATLGVIYDPGDGVDLESAEGQTRFMAGLHAAVWDGSDPPRRVFTVPVALSLMVFFALCAQCAPTLAVIRRETNSWRWPALTFGYMTVLAYVGALATYQLGTWIAALGR